MKQHIETVAVLVDLLTRALEQIGVPTEVLGFTTSAWNGGRAQRDWVLAGRPAQPGRLNEICHLIFKAANTPWRRSRASIAALLKGELFREGIDGEAVEWALRRLALASNNEASEPQDFDAQARRLLLVFSDGSPMDSATKLANDAHYLDHHLRGVVAAHEQRGAEIIGLGVGLDLSPYYSRSQALDLSGTVNMSVLREIIGTFARGARR